MKKKLLWIVANACRFLVSATFIFSGLVKLIDPHGTEYKIQDYFSVLQLDKLASVSVLPLALAIGLALLEFCLGVYLFIGMRRRLTLSLMTLFLIIYTPLTLWLAITNAVTDCGCFGDALTLTNWQTFWKNVILLAAVFLLWWQRHRLTRFFPESAQWIISITAICCGLFLSGYGLYYEPIVDFRPYHVGQHIPTAMQWPDNPYAQPEILDFYFEPYPFQGAAQGFIPEVEELLEDSSYTFLLTIPHMESADDGNMVLINELYDYAQIKGYRFLALTAASEGAISRWRDLTGAEYDFAFMDGLTLKTIARSNPALVIIHNGTIIGKWSHNNLPHPEQLNDWLAAHP